ncbi:MAG: hypothetical protein AAF330_06400, partial [Pseudomonadota bacterium]
MSVHDPHSQSVFFSWQLDLPREFHKDPIWAGIQNACGAGTLAEAALRPDSDTLGETGSPKIMETIYSKIDRTSVFVADVSFVAETGNRKKTPNPNVLLEVGYAARSIGWDRIILVMNKASGRPEDLPFDLRQHRFPVGFKLSDKTENKEQTISTLSGNLTEYVGQALSATIRRVEEQSKRLDSTTLSLMARYKDFQAFPMLLPPQNRGQVLVSSN